MKAQKITVTKQKIDDKYIFIIDNALTAKEIEETYQLVKKLPFTKNERDHEDDEYPIFSVDFEPDKLENLTPVGRMGKKLVQNYFQNLKLSLFRGYVNMCHYGDMEYPHRDCPIGTDHVTVLYYVNNNWDYTWGGATLFYNDNQTTFGVLPKLGRFVIFPGSIEHVGTIPTRECKISRLTLAMKYKNI